ncbi:SDR family oxidoreductase [Aspergillus lucknowensis]|uniref:NAD(P)-binding protein n=1 Tax=Aspergillus lucknowensis TaxID=176173 RepID=A0ABR4LKT8_9EURO
MQAYLGNWHKVSGFVPSSHSEPYPFISPSSANLTGKSVLITGSSKGIGRAIALSFARAGCSKIAIAARSSLLLSRTAEDIAAAAAEAGHPPPQTLEITADVATESGAAHAASRFVDAFGEAGGLDILVNNAGRAESFGSMTELSVDDYWATWEVNVRGPYLVTRQMLGLLLKLDSGMRTVINVSSAGAHTLTPDIWGYQMSKFALCRFTEFLAQDYVNAGRGRGPGPGLVAISVHPGGVVTDMTADLPEDWQPMLRDKPELAADTIVWLVKERRDWLSGRFVSATWDMQELEGRKSDIVNRDLLKFRLTV